MLTEAGFDIDVRNAKRAVLPEYVGLAAWIEARMGEDIELKQIESGQYIFGLPGSLTILYQLSKNPSSLRLFLPARTAFWISACQNLRIHDARDEYAL